jgi:hypothetical protein
MKKKKFRKSYQLSKFRQKEKAREVLTTFKLNPFFSLKDSCDHVGVGEGSFYLYLKKFPDIRERYEDIKEKKNAERVVRVANKNAKLLEQKLEGLTYTERKQVGKAKKGAKGEDQIEVERIEITERKVYASDTLQWNLMKSLNPEIFKEESNVNVKAVGNIPIIVLKAPTMEDENKNSAQEEEEIDSTPYIEEDNSSNHVDVDNLQNSAQKED